MKINLLPKIQQIQEHAFTSFKFKKNDLKNLIVKEAIDYEQKLRDENLTQNLQRLPGADVDKAVTGPSAVATWLATPTSRRGPALFGGLAQSGYSRQAVQDYVSHASDWLRLINKTLPGVGSMLKSAGVESTPIYAAAATLDPRVLSSYT
jgi:hypothetical protein